MTAASYPRRVPVLVLTMARRLVSPIAKGGQGGLNLEALDDGSQSPPTPLLAKGAACDGSAPLQAGRAPYIGFIDRAKAIGIMLVVIGHAPGMPEPLVTFIYSFHMPLFFLLSGYLLSRRKLDLGLGAYAGHLLRSLGLPYLGFFLVSWAYWLATRNLGARAAKFAGVEWYDPLAGLASGIGSEIVVNIALWFFPCLMAVALLYFLARKFLGASAALLLFGALGIVDVMYAGALPERLPWGLDNAWAALVFYALGHWLRGLALPDFGRSSWLLWAGLYLSITVALSVAAGRVDLNNAQFGHLPWLYFPTALAGIVAVLSLSKVLPDNAACSWLARNTVLIFPTHPLAINFLSGLGKLVFRLPEHYFTSAAFGALAAVGSVVACLPLAWLLRILPSIFERRRPTGIERRSEDIPAPPSYAKRGIEHG